MKKTFFTVVGNRDPYNTEGKPGPCLDLIDYLRKEHEFTDVMIAWTPEQTIVKGEDNRDVRVEQLASLIKERLPQAKVFKKAIGGKTEIEPNDATALWLFFKEILRAEKYAESELHINISSGTTQMQQALSALHGTGWFGDKKVTFWQIDDPKYRKEGKLPFKEITAPFLEETTKLTEAFAALRRFDFLGAADHFDSLGDSHIVAQRGSLPALAQLCKALYHLETRNAIKAEEELNEVEESNEVEVHTKTLAHLKDGLQLINRSGAEGALWLTWSYFDKANYQERVSDSLIWASILHEAMVVALLSRQMGQNTDEIRKSEHSELWKNLLRVKEHEVYMKGKVVYPVKEMLGKIRLLETGLFTEGDSSFIKMLDTSTNETLQQVKKQRNDVIHKGGIPEDKYLTDAQELVKELMTYFPFEQAEFKTWQKNLAQSPFSAESFVRLANELEEWKG